MFSSRIAFATYCLPIVIDAFSEHKISPLFYFNINIDLEKFTYHKI